VASPGSGGWRPAPRRFRLATGLRQASGLQVELVDELVLEVGLEVAVLDVVQVELVHVLVLVVGLEVVLLEVVVLEVVQVELVDEVVLVVVLEVVVEVVLDVVLELVVGRPQELPVKRGLMTCA